MGGACLQLGSLLYVWSTYTSASSCLAAPVDCLLDFRNSDVWGRQVVLTLAFAVVGVWLPSLIPLLTGKEKHSDPSIVDRLWNIQPWVYCWHFFFAAFFSTEPVNLRLLIMSGLTTMWGLRITYNFYIKGGFSGGEDYRWAEIRKW